MLTDTHCHLYFDVFQNDLEETVDRARDNGVTRILVPGIDLDTSRKAISLSETFPQIFAAVGVHPNDALTWTPETRKNLRQLARHPKVVAIGEIGLDYYRDHAPPELQMTILREQLELAAEVQKPVLIHNREAIHHLWPVLETWHNSLQGNTEQLWQYPGVLHSFDGSLQTAMNAVEARFYLGISGPVTFKNAKEKQSVVAAMPLNTLLLETDAPFLTPHPHRGKRNEPAFIPHIARKIADLKGCTQQEVAKATSANAQNFLQWKMEMRSDTC